MSSGLYRQVSSNKFEGATNTAIVVVTKINICTYNIVVGIGTVVFRQIQFYYLNRIELKIKDLTKIQSVIYGKLKAKKMFTLTIKHKYLLFLMNFFFINVQYQLQRMLINNYE